MTESLFGQVRTKFHSAKSQQWGLPFMKMKNWNDDSRRPHERLRGTSLKPTRCCEISVSLLIDMTPRLGLLHKKVQNVFFWAVHSFARSLEANKGCLISLFLPSTVRTAYLKGAHTHYYFVSLESIQFNPQPKRNYSPHGNAFSNDHDSKCFSLSISWLRVEASSISSIFLSFGPTRGNGFTSNMIPVKRA